MTTVNKITLTVPRNSDRILNIPVKLDWELLDTENEINAIQAEIDRDVAGRPTDFETNRFSHSGVTDVNNTNLGVYDTSLNYDFYFFSGGTISGTGSTQNWIVDYRADDFLTDEVYYFSNGFKNSFWKLDFYNSPSDKGQTIYLTIILPVTQGLKMPAVMQGQDVTIMKPSYVLDWVGDKDGFFIYWLKSRTYLDIDKFYVSCKFWNAKDGSFTRFVNRPQSEQVTNSFGPNSLFNFYYLVDLDYPTQTYTVYDTITFERVGTVSSPIKWYEYVAP